MRHAALFLICALLLTSCGDSATDPNPVGEIVIDGPSILAVDDTAQAVATVLGTDGGELSSQPVTWASSNQAIATVSGDGEIVALTPGTTTITATSGGVTGQLQLAVSDNPCDFAAGELTLGETVEGELHDGSCRIESWFHDAWLLELEEETVVRIDLESDAFDAFLLLTDRSGNVLHEDDDAGEGDNARIQEPLAAGSYIVWASTFVEDETGEYALTAAEPEESEAGDGAAPGVALLPASAAGEAGGPPASLPRPALRASRGEGR